VTAFLDARIPVVFALPAEARPDDAWLIEGEHTAPAGPAVARFTPDAAHPNQCACCAGRSSAARALSSLFLDRARGRTDFFRRVVLLSQTPAGSDAVATALASDMLVSQWFRRGEV
jgi:hypothetical protein